VSPALIEPTWDWATAHRICLTEARRITGTEADAQDVAQDAIVRAWRSRCSCRDPASPTGWLLTIVRGEAWRVRRRRQSTPVAELPDAEDPCDWTGEVLSRLDVESAVSTLQERDRELLRLRYVDDLTQTDVADRVGLAEGTVKVKLHRLRKKLRDRLEV